MYFSRRRCPPSPRDLLSVRPKKEAEKKRRSARARAPRTRVAMPGNPISCISARKRLGGPMQINLARGVPPPIPFLAPSPVSFNFLFSLSLSLSLSHLLVFSLLVPTVSVPSRILLTLSSSWVKSVAGTLISLVTLYQRFLLGGPTRFRDINKRILPRDGATRRLAIISSPEKRIRDNGPNSAMQSCRAAAAATLLPRDSPSLFSPSLSFLIFPRSVPLARRARFPI